ncbi:MAG: 4-hydroxy-tetrahydrodipicolinate reductase [Endomicrobiia bacterium]
MTTKIIVIGAAGRMGRRIVELSLEDKEVEIVGLVEKSCHSLIGKKLYSHLPEICNNLNNVIKNSDVVIDFSSPEGCEDNIKIIQDNNKAVVIGTTGQNVSQVENIKSASRNIPVILSPNMSIGVNTMFKTLDFVLKILKDKGYDIEIIESHHNKKKDAPSGTAKKFMEIIKEYFPKIKFVFGREGLVGERTKDEVGVFAVRGGDIVGEHTIMFSTLGEKFELKHTATSRDTFVKGAILAAKWLVGKPAGLYNMYDVLGI